MDDRTPGTADRDATHLLVGKWLELWNGGIGLADEIISPDNRVHAALFDGGDGSAVGGVSGMTQLVSQLRSLLPDLVFSVEVGPLIDGDHVAIRWVATGHYGGGMPGAGAPAGTAVTFRGTDILRLRAHLVVEYWFNADSLDLMGQLRVGG